MKFIIAALITLTFTAPAFAKECKTGKACGNSCIAKTATCKADSAKAAPTATPSPTPAKECKTGKPCGNSCIAKDAVCSK